MRQRFAPMVALVMMTAALPLSAVEPTAGTGPARAGGAPALAAEQRVRLEEAFHLAGTLGPEIWPGFDGGGAPVLLMDGEHEFLINRDTAPEGFSPAAGRPFLGKPVFVRPPHLSPQFLATRPAAGLETVVVVGTAEQVGRSPAHWVVTVGHELFHVHQSLRGMNGKVESLAIGPPDDPSWHLDFPFPYEDTSVQGAMHLLGYSLFRAAAPADPSDSPAISYDARTAAEAMDLLELVLTARHDDPRNLGYLRYQSAKEGVARYVEYRLAREAASGSYRPTEAFVAAEGAGAYRDLWSDTYESLIFQVKHLGSVSRSRLEFYSMGLGLALTLDALGEDWQEAYFEPGVWLDDLLRQATGRATAGCALERRPRPARERPPAS